MTTIVIDLPHGLTDAETEHAEQAARNGVLLYLAERAMRAVIDGVPKGQRHMLNPARVALAEARVTDDESMQRLTARMRELLTARMRELRESTRETAE